MRILRDVPVWGHHGPQQPSVVAHAVIDHGNGSGTVIEGFMFLDEKPAGESHAYPETRTR